MTTDNDAPPSQRKSARLAGRGAMLGVVAAGTLTVLVLVLLMLGWARAHVVSAGQVQVLIGPAHLVFSAAETQTAVEGEVAVADGTCLVLRAPDGTERLLVWPHGTDVAGTDEEVALSHDGRRVRVGDTVALAATPGSPSGLEDMFGNDVAQQCRGLDYLEVGTILPS